MLVLSRKPGEEVVIDGNIRIKVVGVEGSRVRLGFEAPKRVQITRPDAASPRRPPVKAAPIRVLVVDDSPEDREFFRRLMLPDGGPGAQFEVAEAETGEAGLELCKQDAPDCVLLDYRLPDFDGLEFLEKIAGEPIAVVFMSGQGDESVAVQAIKQGAYDYLSKGAITRDRLLSVVRKAKVSVVAPPARARKGAPSEQPGRAVERNPRFRH